MQPVNEAKPSPRNHCSKALIYSTHLAGSVPLGRTPYGAVDQLEDRFLGMEEAGGSNPSRSTFSHATPGPGTPWGSGLVG